MADLALADSSGRQRGGRVVVAHRLDPRTNRLLLAAVAIELGLLVACVTGPVAAMLGASAPPGAGWLAASAAVPAVILADTLMKARARRVRHRLGASPEARTLAS